MQYSKYCMRVFHWQVGVFPNLPLREKAATIAIIESIVDDEIKQSEKMRSKAGI